MPFFSRTARNFTFITLYYILLYVCMKYARLDGWTIFQCLKQYWLSHLSFFRESWIFIFCVSELNSHMTWHRRPRNNENDVWENSLEDQIIIIFNNTCRIPWYTHSNIQIMKSLMGNTWANYRLSLYVVMWVLFVWYFRQFISIKLLRTEILLLFLDCWCVLKGFFLLWRFIW